MGYVLSWRRKPQKEVFHEMDMYQSKELMQFLRDNPGFRWKDILLNENKPINYLEIGVFKGHNIIDMSKSYCKHPESKMYCVDPWIDYDEYPEYKGKIQTIYEEFVENMNKENLWDKIEIHRDFSEKVIPTFPDNFFDIVFIDGNHETQYVYNDGEMCFKKLKTNGYMIFDDYSWQQTKLGVDNFLDKYKSEIRIIKNTYFQLFIQKL